VEHILTLLYHHKDSLFAPICETESRSSSEIMVSVIMFYGHIYHESLNRSFELLCNYT
jgi:hypothetical protein